MQPEQRIFKVLRKEDLIFGDLNTVCIFTVSFIVLLSERAEKLGAEFAFGGDFLISEGLLIFEQAWLHENFVFDATDPVTWEEKSHLTVRATLGLRVARLQNVVKEEYDDRSEESQCRRQRHLKG